MNRPTALFYTGILGATFCASYALSSLAQYSHSKNNLPPTFLAAHEAFQNAQASLHSGQQRRTREYAGLVERLENSKSNYLAIIKHPLVKPILD